MLKFTSIVTWLGLASVAQAGDYLEGYYFYVIGTVPASIPFEEVVDVSLPEFRGTLALLAQEWTGICEAQVGVWHSSLMNPTDSELEWTKDQWVLTLGYEGLTKTELTTSLPASPCLARGDILQANMLIPGLVYICNSRETDPELFDQTCY